MSSVSCIQRRSMERPAWRTLQRALDIAGSKQRLCAALWVSVEELEGYLSGKNPVPDAIFLAALDIVAGTRTLPER